MENTKKDRPSEEEMWAGPSGERWLGSALRVERTLEGIGEGSYWRRGGTAGGGEQVVDVGCARGR